MSLSCGMDPSRELAADMELRKHIASKPTLGRRDDTPERRAQAAQMLEQCTRPSDVAKELHIGCSTLELWCPKEYFRALVRMREARKKGDQQRVEDRACKRCGVDTAGRGHATEADCIRVMRGRLTIAESAQRNARCGERFQQRRADEWQAKFRERDQRVKDLEKRLAALVGAVTRATA